jgi:hypothetical protein
MSCSNILPKYSVCVNYGKQKHNHSEKSVLYENNLFSIQKEKKNSPTLSPEKRDEEKK